VLAGISSSRLIGGVQPIGTTSVGFKNPICGLTGVQARRQLFSTSQPQGYEFAYATRLIRKSSIRLPDFNLATSQRGVFPRPAQVSDGRSGFRNFGTTVGYGRRPVDDFVSSASATPLSCFSRFSSTRFSATSVAASLAATSSWSAHNSSVDMDLKSFRFTTVPNHDSISLSSLAENMSRIRPSASSNIFRAIKFPR
jgi:hypothetical protein